MSGRAYLSLGSNVAPEVHLRAAIEALRARFGGIVVSPVYRTPAVGFDGPAFLNAAVIIDSDLEPQPLSDWLHALEDAHGRDRRGARFSDRTLDIDIVLFDDRVLDGAGHLRIPRPELAHAFVLRPLADIAPHVRVPGTAHTLAQLWAAHAEHGAAGDVVTLSTAG